VKKLHLLPLLVVVILTACQNDYIPRPIGYFRIDLPKKEYTTIDSIPFPFQFELPQYAFVNLRRTQSDPNFLNIDFPKYGARIHMSYLPVEENIAQLLENSRTLVYKHVTKAQDIRENLIYNEEDRVFGTYYHIEGNAASGSQFYMTDSSNHFLRGALYFNVQPNFDSIAPVQNFLKADIENLIESFHWNQIP